MLMFARTSTGLIKWRSSWYWAISYY